MSGEAFGVAKNEVHGQPGLLFRPELQQPENGTTSEKIKQPDDHNGTTSETKPEEKHEENGTTSETTEEIKQPDDQNGTTSEWLRGYYNIYVFF